MKELLLIASVIWHARKIQDYFWGKPGTPAEDRGSNETYQEWITNLGYRLERLRKVNPNNKSWKVEARKRAIQLSAVSVAFIQAINTGKVIPKDEN